jgi:tetratricopeptide (TPR) repeat protein
LRRHAVFLMRWFPFLPVLFLRLAGAGVLELEMPWTSPEGERTTATLALAFPDVLAGADVHALLASSAEAREVLLPGGELRPWEADFLEGLRAFARGGPYSKADSAWNRLRERTPDPVLRAYVGVDLGFLLCLRGETASAESLWTGEWRRRGPAWEGAWRNLLGLYSAQHRYAEAERLLDAVLREQPHNRAASLAKAAFLRQHRPDSEWEEFLQSRSSPRDSLPDLQIAYGDLLASHGRDEEAVRFLDLGLARLPGYGRGWWLLAQSQYRLGYHYFALDCLANAGRAGYREADLYELYARVLRACCMGDEDPRAAQAREAARKFLEEGLPKDLHRRSMAQLLYHIYCQSRNPAAAQRLREALWFHFEGPSHAIPALGAGHWIRGGLDSHGLAIRFGLRDLGWVMELRETDFYQAFY